jgi:hypothetical protein
VSDCPHDRVAVHSPADWTGEVAPVARCGACGRDLSVTELLLLMLRRLEAVQGAGGR